MKLSKEFKAVFFLLLLLFVCFVFLFLNVELKPGIMSEKWSEPWLGLPFLVSPTKRAVYTDSSKDKEKGFDSPSPHTLSPSTTFSSGRELPVWLKFSNCFESWTCSFGSWMYKGSASMFLLVDHRRAGAWTAAQHTTCAGYHGAPIAMLVKHMARPPGCCPPVKLQLRPSHKEKAEKASYWVYQIADIFS